MVIKNFRRQNGKLFVQKGHSKIWSEKFFRPQNSAPSLRPCPLTIVSFTYPFYFMAQLSVSEGQYIFHYGLCPHFFRNIFIHIIIIFFIIFIIFFFFFLPEVEMIPREILLLL